MAGPEVVDNEREHRFEIRLDGAVAGYAAYRAEPGRVVFTHTEIDPVFEGRGLGSALARGALDAVRAGGRSIVPQCPFIRGYVERHPEYQDLVVQ
jgi:predicted GNAT family acetyltransferase